VIRRVKESAIFSLSSVEATVRRENECESVSDYSYHVNKPAWKDKRAWVRFRKRQSPVRS
jgi:hypothetical protein